MFVCLFACFFNLVFGCFIGPRSSVALGTIRKDTALNMGCLLFRPMELFLGKGMKPLVLKFELLIATDEQ